jgi:hypothetical protein
MRGATLVRGEKRRPRLPEREREEIHRSPLAGEITGARV